ncbi:MAG TPA: glycosyltransferase, partial [Capsulimonadaceae bacterium]|nr:glycosyltransferase [Capsulimonadaceae bacterium]
MKLFYIVDARIPHARNWITHFAKEGHEVHIVSTFPCEPLDAPMASLNVIPLDFSARLRGGSGKTQYGSPFFARLRGGALWKNLARLRDELCPLAVRIQSRRVRALIDRVQPDLVHAMRIPFEGILAAEAVKNRLFPLVVSVWGNDFTLYATQSPMIAGLTRRTMARTDALHPDCEKDLWLGREWGLDSQKPSVVLPGNGGVYIDIFCPGPRDLLLAERLEIPDGAPVIINPRGVKPYVRTDTFFQAIPIILKERPNAIFLGGMMQGNAVAERWVEQLGLSENVRLLPHVPQREMPA